MASSPGELGAEWRDSSLARAEPGVDFEVVYDVHFDFVWRSLRRMGVPAAMLDDAAQDVFLVVHRQLPRFEPRASLRTWLFAIAYRVASDYRRSARRRGPRLSLDKASTTPSDRPSPFEDAQKAEAHQFLSEFLETLDEAHRAVFILAELEQMKGPEIAEALNVKLNTVYGRIRIARQRFAKAVREHRARRGGSRDE